MQSQVKKLAFICNVCFWLTLLFQYWEPARNIHPDVLSTIVVLGVVAVLVNVVWLVLFFAGKKPVINGSVWAARVITWFNIISLLEQVFYLVKRFW